MQKNTVTKLQSSKIERMKTGVPGFDEISDGGFSRNRTSLIAGGPGCGKTIFALQSMVWGVIHAKEPGIFVAFEERSEQIIANASSFGWNLPALQRANLFFLDAHIPSDEIQSGAFDLSGLLAGISAKAKAMGAKRVVFDGIDVLLMLLNDPLAERRELTRLHNWLATSGLTGIITVKTDCVDGGVYNSYLQYLVDSVVLLRHDLTDYIARRTLRIIKSRGTKASANETAMIIGSRGIELANHGSEEMNYKVTRQRVSSGIERLDTMLGGGFYRASSILISGQPGTAKSTLSGAFAEAACERGERVLYISFDEAASQIVRNMTSVGINLNRHQKSGLLKIYSVRAESRAAEEHFVKIQSLIRDHRAKCLIIDPLSSLVKVGGSTIASDVVVRLLASAKARGVTILCTTLLKDDSGRAEATPLQISTIADTWIHVTYIVLSGERNRALTIVKSRGMGHSNQVREMILSNKGVTLADVYSAGGEVLMGTARWQRENIERQEKNLKYMELERQKLALAVNAADIQSRIDIATQELAARNSELESVLKLQSSQENERATGVGEIRKRRRADSLQAHQSNKRGRTLKQN